MDALTADFYARNAAELKGRYGADDGRRGEELLRAFAGKRKILDVGCGTGRDVAFLLRKGKDAFGTDAVPEMLVQARATLESQGEKTSGRLFQESLPRLKTIRDGEFDGVLCSAVLMHLPDDQVFDAVYALRRILKPGGALMVSVPVLRDDVNAVDRRAGDGRLFSELPPGKLQLLLERMGFAAVDTSESQDSLGRDGILWWTGVFQCLDETVERPLRLVESVLNRDKKDATYKMALFRALAEIAQTQLHLAVHLPNGKVRLPLAAIAEKWLLYYWPIFESEVFIPQRVNETKDGALGVAIRKHLNPLIQHFAKAGGLTGFYCSWKSGQLSMEGERLFLSARRNLQTTIHSMPAKHAGGGHYDVFQYHAEDKSLAMDEGLWRELCLMGSWIRDATILRWAEQTEIFAKGAVKASMVIDQLLLAPDQGRNVHDAKWYFQSLVSRPCVWSHKELGVSSFVVDHAMPFSYWRNNDLWNLFPTDPGVNSRKSDALPTYRQLHSSQEVIIDYWRGLNHAMGERFEREAQTLLGRTEFKRGSWEPLLFERFVEAFEVTASQRGAARWEMPKLEATGVAEEFIRFESAELRYLVAEERIYPEDSEEPGDAVMLISFEEVGSAAFRSYLPVLGGLAAGEAFHGFETDSMDDLEGLDWVKVPDRMVRKNRFVVRVMGESMKPTFEKGELLVFEYHRSPRSDRQIVIANRPEFGAGNAGVEAIKRITQDGQNWIFLSDNPAFEGFVVPKAETRHPILGIYVGKVS